MCFGLPTEERLWDWLVAALDKEAGRGTCVTEAEAKAAAEAELTVVTARGK